MTDLPSTVSCAGAVTFAVGGPSTGQLTSLLSAWSPSSVLSGSPGACTSALTSWTEAEAPCASTWVTDLPMSALTRVTGPCWSTPSTVAVSTEPLCCAGDCTLFSAMSTGTWIALFNRLTRRASSAVTALALPGSGAAPAGVGSASTAVAAVAATTAQRLRVERTANGTVEPPQVVNESAPRIVTPPAAVGRTRPGEAVALDCRHPHANSAQQGQLPPPVHSLE
ncbi:hypothetical protein [Kitasatospora sp. MAP12-44]|uniref:hypothetical protein n=1 Tax=Kitasatospora sp. MAP12-44 TaxID=3035099 RepID=UPI0024739D1B|nr:hypothetical protein [Kitasatospora sp. MAP12-44]